MTPSNFLWKHKTIHQIPTSYAFNIAKLLHNCLVISLEDGERIRSSISILEKDYAYLLEKVCHQPEKYHQKVVFLLCVVKLRSDLPENQQISFDRIWAQQSEALLEAQLKILKDKDISCKTHLISNLLA